MRMSLRHTRIICSSTMSGKCLSRFCKLAQSQCPFATGNQRDKLMLVCEIERLFLPLLPIASYAARPESRVDGESRHRLRRHAPVRTALGRAPTGGRRPPQTPGNQRPCARSNNAERHALFAPAARVAILACACERPDGESSTSEIVTAAPQTDRSRSARSPKPALQLCQRSFVECHQLSPGFLGVGLAVDRLALLRWHVRHAPAVQRARIDFDLRRNVRG